MSSCNLLSVQFHPVFQLFRDIVFLPLANINYKQTAIDNTRPRRDTQCSDVTVIVVYQIPKSILTKAASCNILIN